MVYNPLQQRLVNGFKPHGYTLTTADEMDAGYEFVGPDTALRFVVRLAEGGVALCWTVSPDHDLMTPTLHEIASNLPPDVGYRTFCGSPEEFWQFVADVIDGKIQ